MRRQTIGIIVIALLIIYAGVGFIFSGMIIEGNSDAYSETEEQERLTSAGLTNMPPRENVTFTSGEVTLVGSYYENPTDGKCAIILLHGRGGTRSSMMRFAPVFWDMNCDILAYDMRGTGASSASYQTYGYNDRYDASIAVDWLSERSEIPPSQIGFLGASYGSAVALQTLFERDDLAFVIADSPFSSLRAIVTDQGAQMMGSWTAVFVPSALFWSGIRADFYPSDVSPENAVAHTTTPILLIHGT